MDPTTEFILAKTRERRMATPWDVSTKPRPHFSKLLNRWENASRDGATLNPDESMSESDVLISSAVRMANYKSPSTGKELSKQRAILKMIDTPPPQRPSYLPAYLSSPNVSSRTTTVKQGSTENTVGKTAKSPQQYPPATSTASVKQDPTERIVGKIAKSPQSHSAAPAVISTAIIKQSPTEMTVGKSARSPQQQHSTSPAAISTPTFGRRTPQDNFISDEMVDGHSSSPVKISDEEESRNSSALSDYLNDAISCAQASMKTPPKPVDIVITPSSASSEHTTPRRRHHNLDQPVGIYPSLSDCSPLPLVHTVSVYRKLEKGAQSNERPQSIIVKPPTSPNRDQQHLDAAGGRRDQRRKCHGGGGGGDITKQRSSAGALTSIEYDKMVKPFNEAIMIQQQHVLQASRALSFCRSSLEFRGSRQEVDAQKALLIATERRRCLTAERNRLDDCFRNRKPFGPTPPLGTLTVNSITVPLRREFFNDYPAYATDEVFYFLCILRYRDTLHVTQMMDSDEVLQLRDLTFTNYFQFHDLPHDFEILLDVFVLKTPRELVAYKEKNRGKLATLTKQRTRQGMFPYSPSPSLGGPSTVMDTGFVSAGHLTITLSSVKHRRFSLHEINHELPLQGTIYLELRSFAENIETETACGFLHRFEEIGDTAAWERLWCVLTEDKLKFWKYPEDEIENKPPRLIIDMKNCVSGSVGPASKTITARSHAFSFDNADHTSIILSADTKDEAADWCARLNKLLKNLRTWSVDGHY